MKTATTENGDNLTGRNVENLKFEDNEHTATVDRVKSRRPNAFSIGSRVERELDGLWFPGTIVDAEPDSDCYEIEYDEDMNREGEVSASELRLLDPSRTPEVPTKMELTARQREMLRKDSLLLQTPDYDPNKVPTVILHHQGETNAGNDLLVAGLYISVF
ncbi:hypothetical protein P3T76_004926 [Phytophthora citrophthora]|uniref:Tudor domain-containing protein n=1 Tax=Phytophthora citrophthora TaxID=4793 RepID=A0AAD9GS18_9STRA|nr:hypothetical protein P3T76_004926 [Phytophthora citrophthora]